MNTAMRKRYTRTISVTSGKGGVGKSTLLANLALELGKAGNEVLILDGDLGMANLDIMFGQRAPRQLFEVLSDGVAVEEVLTEVAPHVHLIPGGSGIYELQNLGVFERSYLMNQIDRLGEKFDFLLIDTSPGIADNVLYLNSAAQEILVVLTPDPSSLADAYALIKVLHLRNKEKAFSVVVNMVKDDKEALQVFRRLSDVAEKFLCVSLDYKGFVPMDPELRMATKSQQLILDVKPQAPSGVALRELAEKLCCSGHLGQVKGGMQFFWQQLVGVA